MEDWYRVIWTDESPFVFRYNGEKRIWRFHSERYPKVLTKATVKHDVKINVWGAFSAHVVGFFALIEGKLTGKKHVELMK